MEYERFCERCKKMISDTGVSIEFESDGDRYIANTSNGYTIVGYKTRLVIRVYDNSKHCAVGNLRF